MPRRKKIDKARGSWGNGDTHGTTVNVLPIYRDLIEYKKTGKKRTGLLFPKELVYGNRITPTGNKFLKKMKKRFGDLLC